VLAGGARAKENAPASTSQERRGSGYA